jgi:threonine/homoserine/homoserine lactone efflux protein
MSHIGLAILWEDPWFVAVSLVLTAAALWLVFHGAQTLRKTTPRDAERRNPTGSERRRLHAARRWRQLVQVCAMGDDPN